MFKILIQKDNNFKILQEYTSDFVASVGDIYMHTNDKSYVVIQRIFSFKEPNNIVLTVKEL